MQASPVTIDAPLVLPAEPQLPPTLAEGLAHHQQGRLTEAREMYSEYLRQHPGHPQALGFLGTASAQDGKFDEAMQLLTEAIRGNENIADPQYCVGNILALHDQFSQAVPHYTWAVALGHPRAQARLQALLPRLEQADRLTSYRMLVNFYLTRKQPVRALEIAQTALQLAPDDMQSWALFGRCLAYVRFTSGVSEELMANIARAFTLEFIEYRQISGAATSAILHDERLSLLFSAGQHDNGAVEFLRHKLRDGKLQGVVEHPVLWQLIESVFVNNVLLEQALTSLRAALLLNLVDTATPSTDRPDYLRMIASLARQCFLNEYVWSESVEETDAVEQMADDINRRVEDKADVQAERVVMLGAYRRLFDLPCAAQLEAGKWPEPAKPVIKEQISEPMEEQRLREDIPTVLPVSGEVSELVQSKYEENPYPRWISVPVYSGQVSMSEHMHALLPHIPMDECRYPDRPEVMVAGCGTGFTPNYFARRVRDIAITALDISMSSLAYGKRKSRELGFDNIEYIHGDIQNAGMLEKQFDHIDCFGVLHHMEDLLGSWQLLIDCLKPGGTMSLGLYSELARENVTRAREFVGERGYKPTSEDMRKIRRDIIAQKDDELLQKIIEDQDFFSMSHLRFLMFHYDEYSMTLPEIEEMIAKLGIQFLGFVFEDSTVLPRYRAMFPGDAEMSSFDLWEQFEKENPAVFSGCYSFWVRKPA